MGMMRDLILAPKSRLYNCTRQRRSGIKIYGEVVVVVYYYEVGMLWVLINKFVRFVK